MADTRRSFSDLQALLPDNVTGDISPQDSRDLLASAAVAHIGAQWDTLAKTVIATFGVFVKAAGGPTTFSARGFDLPTFNRLRYIDPPTIRAILTATVAVSMDPLDLPGEETELAIMWRKNGTSDIGQLVSTVLPGTSGKIYAIAVQALVDLSTNDFVELWIANLTNTKDVYVQNGFVTAHGILI